MTVAATLQGAWPRLRLALRQGDVLLGIAVLAILLLGWRLVCHLLVRARRRARTGVPA